MEPDYRRSPGGSDAVLSDARVRDELQRRPHLLLEIAESSLAVATSLREHYFANTARFVAALRRAIRDQRRAEPILAVRSVAGVTWQDLGPEVVTFIDGGLGRVPIAGRAPLLLRVGSYQVRTGERRLTERERFGYHPVILGDLAGGSKERADFPDLVRILGELLGGLVALESTPDLDVLLFHGPLLTAVGVHAGHLPFTEADIDRFLAHHDLGAGLGSALKGEFLAEAARDTYPRMVADPTEWIARRLFEPLSFIAYLQRRLVRVALGRTPTPLVAGVVERAGRLREFGEEVLLPRVFRGLATKGNTDYFNVLFGREDLDSPTALLARLGYTDALLLGMLLAPGEYSEPWIMRKSQDLHAIGRVNLSGVPGADRVDYTPLAGAGVGFPAILGTYLRVTEATLPVRIEFFADLGHAQVLPLAQRAYLYSRLLPGYGFPVGLDIVDKYAHVPGWMMAAYGKLIHHHLGVGLQRGEVGDAELRRLLVQALYLRDRNWLARPPATLPRSARTGEERA